MLRFRLPEGQINNLENLVENTEKASIRAKDLYASAPDIFLKGGEPIIKTVSISKLLLDTSSFSLRGLIIKCHYDIPSDLWNIEADEGQINQVIQNIVINARQAMRQEANLFIAAENCVIDKEDKF